MLPLLAPNRRYGIRTRTDVTPAVTLGAVRSGAWWRVHGVYVGGRTREDSHPAFVAVAPESFYDGTDEFAPFGNDHGSDILGALEDWYTTGGQDDGVPQFLIDTLAGYGYPPSAHLWSADSDAARAWARAAGDDDHFVQATAQTELGIALGQFKIRGHVTSAVRRIGWQAATLQRYSSKTCRRVIPTGRTPTRRRRESAKSCECFLWRHQHLHGIDTPGSPTGSSSSTAQADPTLR